MKTTTIQVSEEKLIEAIESALRTTNNHSMSGWGIRIEIEEDGSVCVTDMISKSTYSGGNEIPLIFIESWTDELQNSVRAWYNDNLDLNLKKEIDAFFEKHEIDEDTYDIDDEHVFRRMPQVQLPAQTKPLFFMNIVEEITRASRKLNYSQWLIRVNELCGHLTPDLERQVIEAIAEAHMIDHQGLQYAVLLDVLYVAARQPLSVETFIGKEGFTAFSQVNLTPEFTSILNAN